MTYLKKELRLWKLEEKIPQILVTISWGKKPFSPFVLWQEKDRSENRKKKKTAKGAVFL